MSRIVCIALGLSCVSSATLAGVEVPKEHTLDGEDISDVLLGASQKRATPLFWNWRFRIAGEPFHHSPMLAIRDGDYKLLMNPDKSRMELYDIPNDPTQLTNLVEKHTDLAERMAEQLLAWHATLPAGPTDPGAGKMNFGWPGKTSTTTPNGKAKARR
jgi:arylsulfatase A-like enzyme